MPYLIIAGIGAAAWVGAQISGWGQATANTLTGTETQNAQSSIPSWVVPTVLVGVGALLLYKEGAKFLKI
jgi:hypothetical protein